MTETKHARNVRLKAMRKKYSLGEFKNKKIRTRGIFMARRRSFKRYASTGGGIVKQVAAGVGGSVLGQKLASMVGLSNYSMVAGLAGAYYAGGANGAIAALVVNTFGNGSTNTTSTSGNGAFSW